MLILPFPHSGWVFSSIPSIPLMHYVGWVLQERAQPLRRTKFDTYCQIIRWKRKETISSHGYPCFVNLQRCRTSLYNDREAHWKMKIASVTCSRVPESSNWSFQVSPYHPSCCVRYHQAIQNFWQKMECASTRSLHTSHSKDWIGHVNDLQYHLAEKNMSL